MDRWSDGHRLARQTPDVEPASRTVRRAASDMVGVSPEGAMRSAVPNLRHLRAFREVASCRSVSLAAQRVFLSQPAVTQAISKLEATLNVALFERRSGGMFTTEAGQLFLKRTERALGFLRTGTKEVVRIGLRKGARRAVSLDQLLTTTQLRSLVAVSNAKNFSLAARAIGISQPSLHRAARDLERLLEIALFEKTSQGTGLTRAGHLLAQHAKLAFGELEQGYAEVDALRGQETGRIVVGTMPLARTFILPTAINALVAGSPKVCVNVVDGPYADLLHGLRHGDFDLLIGALRVPVPVDDVVQEPLFDDPLTVVARIGHPLVGRKRISLRELAPYPWVVPRPGTPTREHFEVIRKKIGAGASVGLIESSSLVLIRGLLVESDRLTLISTHQIRHEQHMGLLAPLPVEMVGINRPIGLTLRRDWHPTATQRRFLDLLRAAGRQAQAR